MKAKIAQADKHNFHRLPDIVIDDSLLTMPPRHSLPSADAIPGQASALFKCHK